MGSWGADKERCVVNNIQHVSFAPDGAMMTFVNDENLLCLSFGK
jgi:hypothetical protein